MSVDSNVFVELLMYSIRDCSSQGHPNVWAEIKKLTCYVMLFRYEHTSRPTTMSIKTPA